MSALPPLRSIDRSVDGSFDAERVTPLSGTADTDNSIVGAPVEVPNSADGHKRPRRHRGRPRTLRSVLMEYLGLAVVAIVLASLIRMFVGLAFYIPSESMVPTLLVKDRVVVSRLSYRFGDPKRGDVIVFRNPGYQETNRPNPIKRVGHGLLELVGVGQPKQKIYIKRIIGLPGEDLMIKDGAVWINGERLVEPWLRPNVRSSWDEKDGQTVKIPEGRYFLMGDNREASSDSRFFADPDGTPHPFIERERIIGRARFRMWPPQRIGRL